MSQARRGLSAVVHRWLGLSVVMLVLLLTLSACTSILHSSDSGDSPNTVPLDDSTPVDTASPSADTGARLEPAAGSVTPLYAIRVDFSSTYNSKPLGGQYRQLGTSGHKVRVRYYVDGVDQGALPSSITFDVYTTGTWVANKSYQYLSSGLILSKDNSECGVRFTIYDSRYEYGVVDNYFVAGARLVFKDRSYLGYFGSWVRASTRDGRTKTEIRLPAGQKSYDGLVDFGNGIWIGLPPGREPWISLSGIMRPYKTVSVWSGGLEEIELKTIWIYVFNKIYLW